ncbi:cyclase family protein [bacterium]|nr:cyclase family protein [bacterium]
MRVLDISRPLEEAVPWPGEGGLERRLTKTHLRDGWETAELRLGSHLGTHVDAPAHLLPDGKRLGELPLDLFIGPALVIDCGNEQIVNGKLLGAAEINPGDRVLLKTLNSVRSTDVFFEDFVYPDESAARVLIGRGISLLGVDGPSVDGFSTEPVAHQLLFSKGIPILEGLDLGGVEAGRYTLVCLPLRIEEAEGAPCRAVLLEI